LDLARLSPAIRAARKASRRWPSHSSINRDGDFAVASRPPAIFVTLGLVSTTRGRPMHSHCHSHRRDLKSPGRSPGIRLEADAPGAQRAGVSSIFNSESLIPPFFRARPLAHWCNPGLCPGLLQVAALAQQTPSGRLQYR
jgi:hypothetical protein